MRLSRPTVGAKKFRQTVEERSGIASQSQYRYLDGCLPVDLEVHGADLVVHHLVESFVTGAVDLEGHPERLPETSR